MYSRYLILALVGIFLIPVVSYSALEPVMVLTFDDIKGDIAEDSSKLGNDGTLQNGPKTIDGKFGKALRFESSRVRVAASKSLGTEIFADGNFSLLLWINADRAGNQWQQIFRAGPNPNDTLFINNDGRLSWRGWVNAAWAGGMCETDAGLVEAKTWTHAAVTSDGKNFRVYINGKLAKETPFQKTRGNNQEYMIGGYAGGESYTGGVDDVVIFAEPLEEGIINSIMKKGAKLGLAVESAGKTTITWGALKQ